MFYDEAKESLGHASMSYSRAMKFQDLKSGFENVIKYEYLIYYVNSFKDDC